MSVNSVFPLNSGRLPTSPSANTFAPEDGPASTYVLSAPYTRWKDVVLGDLDPIRAMMQGKLRVRGDLPTIVREVRSANELVRLLGEVPTEFPDD